MKKVISLLLLTLIMTTACNSKNEKNKEVSESNICQSCAMTINDTKMAGSNADSTLSKEYCVFCYKNGEFTEPNITLEEMIDKCAMIWSQQQNSSEEELKEEIKKSFPNLKRWKK